MKREKDVRMEHTHREEDAHMVAVPRLRRFAWVTTN
jgi:hypothetical protein